MEKKFSNHSSSYLIDSHIWFNFRNRWSMWEQWPITSPANRPFSVSAKATSSRSCATSNTSTKVKLLQTKNIDSDHIKESYWLDSIRDCALGNCKTLWFRNVDVEISKRLSLALFVIQSASSLLLFRCKETKFYKLMSDRAAGFFSSPFFRFFNWFQHAPRRTTR